MATRYNNRNIITKRQTISLGRLLPGMVLTFNYAEVGVTDPRPILLYLHSEPKHKTIEGLNLNYIDPAKIKKLFSVINFKKGKLDEEENLISLKESYFRIQISNPKKRSAMSGKRFYADVVGEDVRFIKSYRSYKTNKLTAIKVVNVDFNVIGLSDEN